MITVRVIICSLLDITRLVLKCCLSSNSNTWCPSATRARWRRLEEAVLGPIVLIEELVRRKYLYSLLPGEGLALNQALVAALGLKMLMLHIGPL